MCGFKALHSHSALVAHGIIRGVMAGGPVPKHKKHPPWVHSLLQQNPRSTVVNTPFVPQMRLYFAHGWENRRSLMV